MSETFELKPMIHTPDGKAFETRAEAMDHMRRPLITAALMKLTEDNQELADWIIDNASDITGAYEVATIKRVTKSERNKYAKALEHAAELAAKGDSKLQFLADHQDALNAGFRWPSVKRLEGADKDAAIKKEMLTLTDGDEEVADFLINTKDSILEALEAGKVKREVSPKATSGLAAWRERQAAEKKAKEEGTWVEPESSEEANGEGEEEEKPKKKK